MSETVDLSWKRRARFALLLIGLMSVFMGWRVSRIGFDYDFESFFQKTIRKLLFTWISGKNLRPTMISSSLG